MKVSMKKGAFWLKTRGKDKFGIINIIVSSKKETY